MLGWNIGASFYKGNSETKDFGADSTQVGITMLGLDARYNNGPIQARGQYTLANLDDTDKYNAKTGNDLGSQLLGYYLELGYNVLEGKSDHDLILFARFERYNTHNETDGVEQNLAYDREDITYGLTYKLDDGVAFKLDYQLKSNASSDDQNKQINAGVGVWF